MSPIVAYVALLMPMLPASPPALQPATLSAAAPVPAMPVLAMPVPAAPKAPVAGEDGAPAALRLVASRAMPGPGLSALSLLPALSELAFPPAPETAAGPATVWRADDGLFYVDARVNGVAMKLIVDTGASMTVLSPDDARRAGIDAAAANEQATAETAGGAQHMARVTLAQMQVGATSAHGVGAVVASQPLAFSLLGQNWLSRMGSVTIEGDRMTLR